MVRSELWQTSLLLFPALVLLHLYISPYTKVEESFNIQAAHDIITYGMPTTDVGVKFKALFDHMTFPGAVPRTFIGAILLAGFAQPLIWLNEAIDQQLLVRTILGVFNALALIVYASGVRKSFGKTAAVWYIALQASQFHIIYYASRTLPNMFAFGPSTVALRYLLPDTAVLPNKVKRIRLAIYFLAISAVVFRSELALLLASQCLYVLVKAPTNAARASLIRTTLIPAGLAGGIAGLILTVTIDTFFWQSLTPLWPEFAAFMSNVLPSKDALGASAWGTSPWHWYLTSALPRLFINPATLLLIPLSLATIPLRGSAQDLLIPNLTYIALYSILPHKETRFLFPVIPPLTATAALSAKHLTITYRRSTRSLILLCLLTLTTALTFILSHLIALPLSSLNYPGAIALNHLHHYSTTNPTSPTYSSRQIAIHMDTLTLQTGVTRFLQRSPPDAHSQLVVFPGSPDGRHGELRSGAALWVYDKSDNATEQLTPEFWKGFDYVITEDPGRVIGAWEIVESIYALSSKPKVLTPSQDRGWKVLGNAGRWRGYDVDVHARFGYGGGEYVLWVWDLVGDVVREGWLLGGGVSLSGGWWVEPRMVERLYILKRGESGIGT